MADIKLTHVRCISMSTPDEILVDGRPLADILVLAAEAAEQKARAEKAEAERDRLLASAARKSCAYCGYITPEGLSREKAMQEISGHVTTCPKNVFRLVLQELEAELAAQIKSAEDDCHRWDEMERKLNRYLAAMTEWVETGDAAFEAARRALIRPEDELPPDVMRGVENRAIRAENAIRAIVEEARRG